MSEDGRSDDTGLTGLRGITRLSVSADTCFEPHRGESGFLAKLAWEGAVDKLDTYLNLTHGLGCQSILNRLITSHQFLKVLLLVA